jgi:hypothetical protein
MTKSKAMENSFGLMVVVTKETGIMESSMEKESMLQAKVLKDMVNGGMARESDGLEEEKENSEEIHHHINHLILMQPLLLLFTQ